MNREREQQLPKNLPFISLETVQKIEEEYNRGPEFARHTRELMEKHDPEVIKRVMDGILIFEKEGGYGAAFLTGALLVWRMIYSENPYTSVDYSGVDFDNHISRLLEEGGIGSAYEQRALENRNIHEFIRNRRFETQEETFAFRAGAGGMYELKRRACELEEKDRIH